jgi:accessory gene regulator B
MDITEKISKICLKFVEENSTKTKEELEIIEYGINVLVINIVKLFILFLLSYILSVTIYTLIAVLSFAFVRLFASGVHAASSIKCTVTNILLFLGNVYLSLHISINNPIKIVILTLSLLLILLYAPADTEDRPLVSRKLRKKLKIYSILVILLLSFVAIGIKKATFSNLVVFSVLEESLLITPLAYYIFNKPYDNYINMVIDPMSKN